MKQWNMLLSKVIELQSYILQSYILLIFFQNSTEKCYLQGLIHACSYLEEHSVFKCPLQAYICLNMNVIINIQSKMCNMKFSTFHPVPDKGGTNSRQTLQCLWTEACYNSESECNLWITWGSISESFLQGKLFPGTEELQWWWCRAAWEQ